MAKIIVCLNCNEKREHEAFGLCRKCYDEKIKYSEQNKCLDCGKLITNLAERCRSCCAKTKTRKNSPAWKSGFIKNIDDRVLILVGKEHPMANNKGYCFRSRLVMAKKIKRMLKPQEVVHHINGIAEDDREGNLMLFATSAEHLKYHAELRENNA